MPSLQEVHRTLIPSLTNIPKAARGQWSKVLAELCNRVANIPGAEQFILKEFTSNYVTVKLCNKFIIDVSSPILTLINHFESEEPKIFDRFDAIGDFMVTFMAKFMKYGGGQKKGAKLTTKDLLNVDVMDKELQLSDANIYLGPKVEAFWGSPGIAQRWPPGLRR